MTTADGFSSVIISSPFAGQQQTLPLAALIISFGAVMPTLKLSDSYLFYLSREL